VNHEPTRAAAYLAGELSADEHGAYEEHLLACEECWAEVEVGRRGRSLVEQVREQAPPRLRQMVVELASLPQPAPGRALLEPLRGGWRRRRLRLVAGAAAVLVLLGGVLASAVIAEHRGRSEPYDVAVSGFLDNRLPGSRIPGPPAPDLSQLRFSETAAGAGELGGLPVNAYAYRDQTGRRLIVYLGARPFPIPEGAEHYEGVDGSWVTHARGVAVLCGRAPHTALILGEDERTVMAAAQLLDLA
jgi:hypothetical protein